MKSSIYLNRRVFVMKNINHSLGDLLYAMMTLVLSLNNTQEKMRKDLCWLFAR